ncbi:hypothetical protein DL93DRAFT_2074090 [Clavulina sp. PMI_390]|nr:hypothetical protein DL93DRAFT_2074090 [Clavulina sp. PMI_390]
MSNSTAAAQAATAEMLVLARDLVGPLLLGALLNVWLYGAFMMQVQTYFQNSPTDPLWMKTMVGGLAVLDTLNSILSCYVAYDYSVNDFGNVSRILTGTPVFAVMIISVAVVGSIVQIFFGFRVKWLTGNVWLGWAVIFAAFMQGLLGIGTSTAGYIVREFVDYFKFRGLVIAWLILAAVVDLSIATVLVTFLRQARTGFEETDDFLASLTRLTIQTGLITAVWATVDCVLFLTLDNNWHFVLVMSLAKLYGNCLMSSLNARMQHHQQLSSAKRHRLSNVGKHNPIHTDIHVTTTSGIHVDDIEMEAPRAYTVPQVPIVTREHRQMAPGGTTFGVAMNRAVSIGSGRQDDTKLVWDM